MKNVKLRNAIIRVLLESRSDEQVTYIADKIINFCLIEKSESVDEVPCSAGLSALLRQLETHLGYDPMFVRDQDGHIDTNYPLDLTVLRELFNQVKSEYES